MATSILASMIKLASSRVEGKNQKLSKLEVQELLGELYQKTKEGSREEKEILKFAEANKLMIIIP